ncbi:uncharacterized protein LOC111020063 [Momordica charantia]|uniref:Uncharacterized protein LOC111020063 n=1 Tax=Momordica charantia TaxID=3673 RepID=A0A6J1DHC5_MOMCH|nr:uncharacterized protein LOC111020063 [Momordica charantia]
MESLNSVASSTNSLRFLPSSPISGGRRRRGLPSRVTASSRSREADNSGRNNHYASGKLVEESMIVLRKRIHEMKMAEREAAPPADWLEWEKRFYRDYDSHVCEALGYLQSHLMNTRPSVALAFLTLLTLSVPVSSALILHRFFHIAAALLAGIHPI